jgi:hypothetical protein
MNKINLKNKTIAGSISFYWRKKETTTRLWNPLNRLGKKQKHKRESEDRKPDDVNAVLQMKANQLQNSRACGHKKVEPRERKKKKKFQTFDDSLN